MEIKIALPQSSSVNTYKGLMGYLKQFELAIHHAQKAVQNAEASGIELTEDAFVCFEHPCLQNLDVATIETKDLTDNLYSELQSIDLRINLQ